MVPLEFQPAPNTPGPIPRTSGLSPPTQDGPLPICTRPGACAEPAAGGRAGGLQQTPHHGEVAPHSKATCRFWGAKHANHACVWAWGTGAQSRFLVLAEGVYSDTQAQGPPALLWVPHLPSSRPASQAGGGWPLGEGPGRPRLSPGRPTWRAFASAAPSTPPCFPSPAGARPGDTSACCLETRQDLAGRKVEATPGCRAEPSVRGRGHMRFLRHGAAREPSPYLVKSMAEGAGESEQIRVTPELKKGTGHPRPAPAVPGPPTSGPPRQGETR